MLINLLGLIICTDCIEYVGQEARRDGQYMMFLKGVNHKGFQRYLWISEDQKDVLAKMFDIEIRFKGFDKEWFKFADNQNNKSPISVDEAQEKLDKDLNMQAFLDTSIEDLNLTQRTFNILSDRGCSKVKDVMRYSASDLLDIQGFGVRSLREIKGILQNGGLSLKD